MPTDEEISAILQEAGVSPLPNRVAILNWLVEHPVHPTVATIYEALSGEYPKLSRTTVYNCLKLLSEKQIIRCLNIEDGELRYDATLVPHAHVKCRICGKLIDVMDGEASPVVDFKGCHDWRIESIQVNYYGICPDCQ